MMENMHENYNMCAATSPMAYDNDRYKYEMDHNNMYAPNKDYQANYSGGGGGGGSIIGISSDTPYNLNSNYHQKSIDAPLHSGCGGSSSGRHRLDERYRVSKHTNHQPNDTAAFDTFRL